MARIRSIKPEYWQDEELAGLPRDARLLYIGLWNLADEHGRLRGAPRYVKGQLFPYDDDLSAADVGGLLDLLADIRKVRRYQVAGADYLWLPNLDRHQRLEAAKVPSKLPGPEDADGVAQIGADKSARDVDKSAPMSDELISSGDSGSEQGKQPAQIGADKSARGADKSALLYGTGSMEHGAWDREHVTPPAARATPTVTAADDPDFDHFWSVYPRREAKADARKAWPKAVKKTAAAVIITAAERYRDQPGRETKFTAMPASWLNGERWADEPAANGNRASPAGNGYRGPFRNPTDPNAYTEGL